MVFLLLLLPFSTCSCPATTRAVAFLQFRGSKQKVKKKCSSCCSKTLVAGVFINLTRLCIQSLPESISAQYYSNQSSSLASKINQPTEITAINRNPKDSLDFLV